VKKILIVEDVAINIDLLTQLLEDDYTLLVAEDGEAGLELAGRERPDLVLMDMSLPVIDGYTATARLKADPVLCAIPVIGLSAHAMAGDEARARAAGCDDYLTKPLHEDDLFAILCRYLAD